MKNIILLGATGYMGRFCLDVISSSPIFNLVAISGKTNKNTLKAISYMYDVPFYTDFENESYYEFIKRINERYKKNDTIAINAISGYSGFLASRAFIDFGYDIVLANKETIVCGGELFLENAKQNGCEIYPIDSEMYAFKCLISAFNKENISKYYITATGGPFATLKRSELHNIKFSDAIKHPIWKMGEKISIDSATMVNKALEIVECSKLFNIPSDKVETVIHKEGYVHSAIKTNTGIVYPQVYKPTQKQAIKDTLFIDTDISHETDIELPLSLHFEKIDNSRFPIINTAINAISNPSQAIVMNASNEKAVDLFKNGEIAFDEIDEYVINKTEKYKNYCVKSYKDIDKLDSLVRQ